MTGSVSHSASAPAAVREWVMALPHAAGQGPTMRWHWFIVGGGTSFQAQARRSGCRRFTELGGRRAAGFKGGSAVYPWIRARAVKVRSHGRHHACFTEVMLSHPHSHPKREALLLVSVCG